MKNFIFILALIFIAQNLLIAQNYPAYFRVGEIEGSILNSKSVIKDALSGSGFTIIGEYQPANNENLAVICYSNPELEKIALGFEDRGLLASPLKIGLKKEGALVKISMLNPMYLFYAYLVEDIEKKEAALSEISEKAISAMKKVGTDFTPFGGALDKNKLQKYRYKVMMPYFKDAEKLNDFASFEEGLEIIRSNLNVGKGNTEKVFEIVYPDKKVAVFGVGLKNEKDGEARFLPIIGEDHLAAMPYELILQRNKATILPGRYRIALHWPELTMGTFMKIMSTPGDIKNTMQKLTE